METSSFYKYVIILLAIIVISVVAIAIALIYTVIKIQPTLTNVNKITQSVSYGIDNAKKDIANIRTKGQNTVQNFVSDAKDAFPSVFNWLESK